MYEQKLVSEWIFENFTRAKLFEQLGIDFCCGGKKTLKEACQENHLDVKDVICKIQKWDQKNPSIDPKQLSPSALCDHIESSHHQYLKERMPFIERLLKKMVKAHGDEYAPLEHQFHLFAEELKNHMEKEEKDIFPKIRTGQNIQNQCQELESEHENAGKSLAFFRKFTNGYAIPSEAFITHQTAMQELEALESDMHAHVYKENYLLFPKASW